jgi:predicted transcriptional regulator
MGKLSNKQRQVLEKMLEQNSYIVYMKGLKTSCFFHGDLSYKISTTTMFKLQELGVIEEKEIKWNSSEFYLTNYGKELITPII